MALFPGGQDERKKLPHVIMKALVRQFLEKAGSKGGEAWLQHRLSEGEEERLERSSGTGMSAEFTQTQRRHSEPREGGPAQRGRPRRSTEAA